MKLILFLLILFSFVSSNDKYIILDENCNSKYTNICKDINKSNFYPQEKWVLKQLCDKNVEEANLTIYLENNDSIEKNNTLTEKFLKDTLLSNNFKNNKIKISNAIFNEEIDLSNFKIQNDTRLFKCIFKKKLKLIDLKSEKSLFFENSIFKEKVDLNGLNIKSQFSLSGSTFEKELIMQSLKVKDILFMDNNASFQKVYLMNAEIGWQLNLRNSYFNNTLDMQGIKVDKTLFMDNNASFQKVNLRNAEIGGQVILKDAKLYGILNMEGIKIDKDLLINENTSFKKINLKFSNIRNLIIQNTKYNEINLAYSKINDILSINNNNNNNGNINLKSSQINVFDVYKKNNISLLGFKFETLSDNLVKEKDMKIIKTMLSNSDYYHSNYQQFADFYKRIGEVDKANDLLFISHCRNLWENIKSIYMYGDLSFSIIFLIISEFLSALFIGFGYKLYFAFLWLMFFTLLGASIAYNSNLAKSEVNNLNQISKSYDKRSFKIKIWDFLMLVGILPFILFLKLLELIKLILKAIKLIFEFIYYKENVKVYTFENENVINDKKWALIYSFDKLIPFVTLNKEHEDLLPTTRWKRGYFYFHQIMGYVLATFIIIGISRVLS